MGRLGDPYERGQRVGKMAENRHSLYPSRWSLYPCSVHTGATFRPVSCRRFWSFGHRQSTVGGRLFAGPATVRRYSCGTAAASAGRSRSQRRRREWSRAQSEWAASRCCRLSSVNGGAAVSSVRRHRPAQRHSLVLLEEPTAKTDAMRLANARDRKSAKSISFFATRGQTANVEYQVRLETLRRLAVIFPVAAARHSLRARRSRCGRR